MRSMAAIRGLQNLRQARSFVFCVAFAHIRSYGQPIWRKEIPAPLPFKKTDATKPLAKLFGVHGLSKCVTCGQLCLQVAGCWFGRCRATVLNCLDSVRSL